MRISIPDNLRLALSKKYLDWAEALPKTKSGIFKFYQSVRKDQKEQAQHTLEDTKPPNGVDIDILGFRLIEMYRSEDTDQLINAITRLFPNIDDDYSGRNPLAMIREYADNISGSMSLNLGCIVRDRKSRFFPGLVRESLGLSPDVDYIEVWLYKVLPSLFIITFDVHLTNEPTKKLDQLQKSLFLPEVRFRHLVPYMGHIWARSNTPSYLVKRKEITRWFEQLRYEVEKFLQPYISGYFIHQPTGGLTRLPSIELIGIKGMPEDLQKFDPWLDHARSWWTSLGFSLNRYEDRYTNGCLSYLPASEDSHSSTKQMLSHRMIVNWDVYLRTITLDQFGNDERTAVYHNSLDVLVAITPLLTLLEFLKRSQNNIEMLRRIVFRQMSPGLVSRFISEVWLNRQIRLNNEVLQASMLLDRISSEFSYERKWVSLDMRCLENFRNASSIETRNTRTLNDDLVGEFDYRVGLLGKHVEFIEKWFAKHLSLRNMYATYLLTVFVVVLTIVSLVISIMSLEAAQHVP